MVLSADAALDAQMRAETVCRGCGKPKEPGLVVCWGCFKYRQDLPFKHFPGSLQEWLDAVAQAKGGQPSSRSLP